MKKIYNILLTAAALLAFAPSIWAQSINDVIKDAGNNNANPVFPEETDTGVHNDQTNKVAYSKNISQPFSDGTYWIKLETFATGSAATILTSTPSDIILILDSSTSMDTNDYGGDYTYNPSGNQNTNYYGQTITSAASGNNPTYYYYYYEPDQKYYRITLYGNAQGQGRNLTFTTDGGTQYFLNNRIEGGIGTTPADQPTGNSQTTNNIIWTGQLYTRTLVSGTTTTRLAALQEATKTFIDNIWQNDHDVSEVDPTYPGNRIAIITYDDNAYTLNSSGRWVQNGTASWFDIGANGVRATLEDAVDDIDTHNWTRPDLGMAEAISDLLSGNTEATSKREGANLVVVMFTDGVPAHSQGTGSTFENQDANKAIYQGSLLKQNYGAKLYTVGLIDPISTNQNLRKGRYFLDLLSSNYPESSTPQNNNNGAWNANTDGTVRVENLTIGSHDVSGNYYQLVDENTNLNSIFDEISQQAGGNTNQSLSAATSTVDIVSSSFILPDGVFEEGADIKDFIRIFTAKLNKIENGEYIFDTEVIIDKSEDKYYALDEHGVPTGEPLDVDALIDVELEGTNGIKVVGFDYSANFCGPVYKPGSTTEVDHYQGHKLMIMIPVKMNPDAVGGPNVPTNAAGSGIILDGAEDPLVPFESPAVSLPVNIYIKKTGLNHGESAKFKIERAEIPMNETWTLENLTFTYVSTVFVTQPETATDETPVLVKVKGLPANKSKTVGYLYKVTEEDWAWSYGRDKTPQYTVTSKVDNPFTFDNEKKDGIEMKLHHAESKVNNVFKSTGATKELDDSKTNDR